MSTTQANTVQLRCTKPAPKKSSKPYYKPAQTSTAEIAPAERHCTEPALQKSPKPSFAPAQMSTAEITRTGRRCITFGRAESGKGAGSNWRESWSMPAQTSMRAQTLAHSLPQTCLLVRGRAQMRGHPLTGCRGKRLACDVGTPLGRRARRVLPMLVIRYITQR